MYSKYLLVLLLLLNTTELLFAQTENKFEIVPHYGFQKQDFRWSISGNSRGESPNVYSELRWKHISGPSAGASLKWNIWKNFVFSASFQRTTISSGKVNDQDYAGDNRTGVIYNETFDSDKGNTAHYSGELGFVVFKNSRWKITPYAGYIGNHQNLYLLDHSGRFNDLNSTYSARWKGVFIRIYTELKINEQLMINPVVQYNQLSYNARGNWNLIQAFQHPISYRHDANGYGIETALNAVYQISDDIAAFAGGSYFNWQTGNGNDILYLNSGEVRKTQLNGVFSEGFQVKGGLILSF